MTTTPEDWHKRTMPGGRTINVRGARLFTLMALLAGWCVAPARADLRWWSFEQAKGLAREQGLPILLMLEKSWCPVCKRLGPAIEQSQEIVDLAPQFVFARCADDCETNREGWTPDGKYYPRILFFDKEGAMLPQHTNFGGRASAKYFYGASVYIMADAKGWRASGVGLTADKGARITHLCLACPACSVYQVRRIIWRRACSGL